MAAKLTTSLSDTLDQLATFERTPYPVVTLYLNTQADQHGRDKFDTFLRKEFDDRVRSYRADTPERHSLEQDAARIRAYLEAEVRSSANGVAIFASHDAGLFEALQLTAPIDRHRLYIDHEPHLYPLARLDDQYPRYAVLLVNTNFARLYVVGSAEVEHAREVVNPRTRRTQMGGWSQARYQRHADNYHLHHIKEVIDVLDQVVREERIAKLVISAEEVTMPIVREHLPAHLEKILVDVLRLDMVTPERELIEHTLAAVREQDATRDAEKVEAAIGAWRAGGLGAAGIPQVRQALERGQVDELLISARADVDFPVPANTDTAAQAARDTDTLTEQVAEELVTKARQTSARITFVEDPQLLALVGGVAALLRFVIDNR